MPNIGLWDSGIAEECVTFFLNGVVQNVRDLPVDTSLVVYIRDHAHLKGTKYMCREGGCGSCVVNLTDTHPVTGLTRSYSVNACLYPVYSCHGKSVTTVEGIRQPDGCYNPIQERLAHFYGTQCGYCSPGWVMTMYSLLRSKPSLTMQEIEDSLGSNICRCTGYRPILDAFKSFGSDCSEYLQQKLVDIEELKSTCNNKNGFCRKKCEKKDRHDREVLKIPDTPARVRMRVDCSRWYRVGSVAEIFQVFDTISNSYMLVAGNTGQGVFSNKYPPPPEVYIDVGGVAELQRHWIEDGHLHLGGNMTLTDTLDLFDRLSQSQPQTFQYLSQLARHIEKIAHIPVRNVGTLAGSLSIKRIKRSFESDTFTVLETVGATLKIVSAASEVQEVTLPHYLQLDMTKKVITEVILPPLDSQYYFVRTFKVGKIYQNAHAYVNAGFLFKLNGNYKILDQPRIVYGGISGQFIHAGQTERLLEGRLLLTNNTLQAGLESLDKEVKPERELPQASVEYRKRLALALFYKFVLGVNTMFVDSKYRSGGEELQRELSSGKQEFSSDPSLYPLNKPMPKLEALIQCSGEIQYNNDLPQNATELFAALVLSDRGPADIEKIDPSPALNIKGVVAFFKAEDIPGKNVFDSVIPIFIPEQEMLFAEKTVQFAGQPLGVVVACTQELADRGASKVVVCYSHQTRPKMMVTEVLEAGETERILPAGAIVPTGVKIDVRYNITGTFSTSPQYHYSLETNTCVVYPTVEGLDVHVSSHSTLVVQEGIAALLGISATNINIIVSRCGGSFGGKITRANIPACACALAAFLLRRPVRILVNMQTNMQALGARKPAFYKYEVGVDEQGVIQRLVGEYYDNVGNRLAEDQGLFNMLGLPGVYDPSTWSVTLFNVKTERPTTAWMRAPGNLTVYQATENLMEHIASVVKKDPLLVRMRNFNPLKKTQELIDELIDKADYYNRQEQCREFNSENKWKKLGIALLPMSYHLIYAGNYHALISIYRNDGSIVITHGGIELGQGLNTQAAQTCAKELGVPLDYVQVQSSMVQTSPNDIITGGSVTSDGVTVAVTKCCEILNERLAPIRAELVNPDWPDLIEKAAERNVNLNAEAIFDIKLDGKPYETSGVAITEVEIDCLTGEHQVMRVDVLEDAGQSVNPYIDIGQVEGALVMALGLCICEEIMYNTDTGRLLTDRSWEYKVPQVKDIPVDMRVYLKENSVNRLGPTRAKAVSEPPMLLGYSVVVAARRAIQSFREDSGQGDDFFTLAVSEPPMLLGYSVVVAARRAIQSFREDSGQGDDFFTLAVSEPPMLLGYSVVVGARRAIQSFREDSGQGDDFFTPAVSEPPMLLCYSVVVAARRAIQSFRQDSGQGDDFFTLDTPATRERLFLTCNSDYKQYLLRE